MVTIELRDLLVRLAEDQALAVAGADPRAAPVALFVNRGGGVEDLAIEAGDPVRGPFGHIEFDIGHAETDRAELVGLRLIEAEAIAPRAGRLDILVGAAAIALAALEPRLDRVEALAQIVEARTTRPIWPRSTLGSPFGRWNWLLPTL